MKRILLLVVLALAITALASAQRPPSRAFSGKVEYRSGSGCVAGGHRTARNPAQRDDQHRLQREGDARDRRSTVEVSQLTRLTVEELADDGSTVSTGVFVPVGRVRATVTSAGEPLHRLQGAHRAVDGSRARHRVRDQRLAALGQRRHRRVREPPRAEPHRGRDADQRRHRRRADRSARGARPTGRT